MVMRTTDFLGRRVNHCWLWAFPALRIVTCTHCIDKTFNRVQTKRKSTTFVPATCRFLEEEVIFHAKNGQTKRRNEGLLAAQICEQCISWEPSSKNGIQACSILRNCNINQSLITSLLNVTLLWSIDDRSHVF